MVSALLSGCTGDGDEDDTIPSQGIDAEKVQTALSLAEDWLVSNVNDEGYFNYLYDPVSGQYSTSNNMIRQLMASRQLAEMSQENTSLRTLHRKNLDYVLANWYQEIGENGFCTCLKQ